jgi:hypothetical protein
MPRKQKLELTWYPYRSTWCKYYQGKRYYSPVDCNGKSDQGGYAMSLQWWSQKRLQIDSNSPSVASSGKPLLAAAMATDYGRLPSRAPVVSLAKVAETSIPKLVEIYLNMRRAEAESGQFTVQMYGEFKTSLEDWAGFAAYQKRKTITEVDSDLLASYRAHQLYLTTLKKPSGGIGPHLARKRLQHVKRFITWADEHDLLERFPKVLNRKYAQVKLPKPKPQFFAVDEVRAYFESSPKPMKLFISIALNGGFTQKDIATLTHSMFDHKKSVIQRERSKTEVPQVCKLWPVTSELLRSQMTKGSGDDLLLLGSKGNPLTTERIRDDGNIVLTDTIKLAFDRVKKKLGTYGDGKGFKLFRKTGANDIEKEYQEFPHVRDLYLAHSSRNRVADHYVKRHFDLLFKATDYLETLYDLNSV